MFYFPNEYPHFKPEELKCKCGQCGSTGHEMDPALMALLEKLRDVVGSFALSSAFRCPTYNTAVSATGILGPHTTGKAVDIACTTQKAYVIIAEALKLGFTGIGVNQKNNGRFIHLDILTKSPRPNVWSY